MTIANLLTNENMALISIFGIIIPAAISAVMSFIINKNRNKTELEKIHSKFIEQLYSKRLEAYLEIYKSVSGFIKTIERKNVSDKELNNFYEEYSILDSKSALLFNSHTVISSAELMDEIRKIFIRQNPGNIFCDDIKKDLIKKLENIESAMKYELGALEYESPSTIENRKFIKSYKEKLRISASNEQMIKDI